jgi:hypothetical protein
MHIQLISLFSFFTLISPLLLQSTVYASDPFPVERAGKTYQCMEQKKGSIVSYIAVVKSGTKYITYAAAIKRLEAQILKAATKKRSGLVKTLNALRKAAKAAATACKASGGKPSTPPTATPTPPPPPPGEPTPVPDHLSLAPYTGVVTKDHARRLLESAAYGLSIREQGIFDLALTQGLPAAIAKLMEYKEEPADLMPRVTDRFDNTLGNLNTQMRNNFSTSGFDRAELDFAINSNNPYYVKLQHFFLSLWTAGADVLTQDQLPLWWDYWTNVLYKSAREPDLIARLIEVGRSPLMLKYLDNNVNLKFQVNENYAREVMELFSMGSTRIDRATGQLTENYVEYRENGDRTKGDIYRIAECFTGWRLSALPDGMGVTQWRSVYSDADHQEGTRPIFEGTPWAFNATDDESVIRGIFANHPAPRDYIATQLLEWYLTPNPPIELVRALGDLIHADGYKLNITMPKLFASKAFYDSRYVNTVAKTSHTVAVEFIRTLNLHRAGSGALNLEAGVNIANLAGNSTQSGNLERVGFKVTVPTDVFYFRKDQWTNPSTLLETVNLLYGVLASTTEQQRIGWTAGTILPIGEAYADAVISSVAERMGCSMPADARAQMAYYLNYRKTNATTFTRTLYDNLILAHQSDKARYLPAMIMSQPSCITQ